MACAHWWVASDRTGVPPRVGDEGLDEAEHALTIDSRLGKELAHLSLGEENDLLHFATSRVAIANSRVPTEAEPGYEPDARAERHPLKARREKMWLEREAPVGRLHEIALRHAADLIRHAALIL